LLLRSLTLAQLFNLLLAANFLDNVPLVEQTCKAVAEMIKKLPQERIAPVFNASTPCQAAAALAVFHARLEEHLQHTVEVVGAGGSGPLGDHGRGAPASAPAPTSDTECDSPTGVAHQSTLEARMRITFKAAANTVLAAMRLSTARSGDGAGVATTKAENETPSNTVAAEAVAAVHVAGGGSGFPSSTTGRMVNVVCSDNAHVLLTRQEAVGASSMAHVFAMALLSVL